MLEYLHAANSQKRQHGNGKDDYSDAAEAVENRPPQQYGPRRMVKIGDNGCAGGADSRRGFEYGVGPNFRRFRTE